MARKIQVLLTCDLDDDDTPAVETVPFSWNGTSYAIELCQEHLDEFTQTMESFTSAARREGTAAGSRRRRSGPVGGDGAGRRPSRAGKPKEDLPAIRAWARAEGYKVSDRGRISAEIRQAWEAAQSA